MTDLTALATVFENKAFKTVVLKKLNIGANR